MNHHVSLGIQHKDIGFSLAPAAAGNTKIDKRCLSFGADKFCRVFDQSNEVASVLILVGRVCIGGDGLRIAIECLEKDQNRN